MKYIKTYENRFLNNIKGVFDHRIKLARSIVNLINEISPNSNCRSVNKNGRIYIKIHKSTDLMLFGRVIHQYTDEFGGSQKEVNVNILPEHSIHEFLSDIFKNYEEYGRINVKYDDIPYITERITKENYEKFLLEQDVIKYNI